MLNKKQISGSFSKYAATYNTACDFQRETALKLIGRISAQADADGAALLDVGCGTGSITGELAKVVKRQVHGCDMAWGMTSFLKANTTDIIVSQADAEALPYKSGAFDIVFSNMTYQWLPGLDVPFLEVHRVLKDGGRFYFSVLIKDSLRELYSTINSVVKKDLFRDFLPTAEQIFSGLKAAGLATVWHEQAQFKKYHKDPMALMKSLKHSGAGRIPGHNIFGMGQKRLFFEMTEEYNRNFSESGNIFATFKVLLGCARK